MPRAPKPTDPTVDPYEGYPVRADSYGVLSRGVGKAPQIGHANPRVAAHIARLLLRNNMDYRAVASKMLSEKGVTEQQITAAATTLEASGHVSAAVNELYRRVGLTDEGFQVYVSKLWEVYADKDSKHWPAAARQLGTLYGIDKKADEKNKPQELPLKGLDEGLRKMFGAEPPDVAAKPTGFSSVYDTAHDDTIGDIKAVKETWPIEKPSEES